MKKRLLALALALGLTVSLAACSGGAGTASTPAPETAAPETAAPETAAAGSDVAYVQDKGTLVVGMTDFAPMDYKDESGAWIGFDADMAKAFAADLGVEVEFLEINWDNKLMELEAKGIDCVWNGMTLTDEVKSGASTSEPYCNNGQWWCSPRTRRRTTRAWRACPA